MPYHQRHEAEDPGWNEPLPGEPAKRAFNIFLDCWDKGLLIRTTGDTIASGTNVDDLGDYRPGLRAAAERGIVHPDVDAALAKADVYALARHLGLGAHPLRFDRIGSPQHQHRSGSAQMLLDDLGIGAVRWQRIIAPDRQPARHQRLRDGGGLRFRRPCVGNEKLCHALRPDPAPA